MARRIVWTEPAEKDLNQVLNYWVERNGSTTYSRRLYGQIQAAVERTIRYPYLGRPTDMDMIRVFRVEMYLVFYEVMADAIVVHHVWDGRRDLKRLEF